MKFLSLTALLIFGLAMNVSAQSTKDGRFWIPPPVDVKWRRIPGAPPDAKKRTVSTTVPVFPEKMESLCKMTVG